MFVSNGQAGKQLKLFLRLRLSLEDKTPTLKSTTLFCCVCLHVKLANLFTSVSRAVRTTHAEHSWAEPIRARTDTGLSPGHTSRCVHTDRSVHIPRQTSRPDTDCHSACLADEKQHSQTRTAHQREHLRKTPLHRQCHFKAGTQDKRYRFYSCLVSLLSG